MDARSRRASIIDMLSEKKEPLTGTYIAKVLNVSRQVIVQDMAILRAEGKDIIATPQGYIIPGQARMRNVRKVIACTHNGEQIEDELKTIVALGGRVIDVIVEHPVYGELKGMLMISSLYDIGEFIRRINQSTGQPLLVLTKGVHLHTIEADNEAKLSMIEDSLRKKGFLIDTDI